MSDGNNIRPSPSKFLALPLRASTGCLVRFRIHSRAIFDAPDISTKFTDADYRSIARMLIPSIPNPSFRRSSLDLWK